MLKRAFDIVFSAGWLIGFAPLLLVVAILVRLRLGSPVLFVQERPGLRAKPFRMVKFRTMTDARGPDGELLPDEQRLTAFGKFLRSTTLDEFPEMWNVLLGDMSVVGPRPLLMRYVPRYDAFSVHNAALKALYRLPWVYSLSALGLLGKLHTGLASLGLDVAQMALLSSGTLDAASFVRGAGAKAVDNNDYFFFDTARAVLAFDPDGSGVRPSVDLVNLFGTGVSSLTANDIYLAV